MSCEGILILFYEVHWENIFVGISWSRRKEKRFTMVWSCKAGDELIFFFEFTCMAYTTQVLIGLIFAYNGMARMESNENSDNLE